MLVVPFHCDGGADRAGSALGLRKVGSEWIGDCPVCKRSGETLSVRQSRDGHRAHILCVCRGGCSDSTAYRAALSEILGPESLDYPHRTGGTLPFKASADPIGDTEP